MKILIVEDEPKTASFLMRGLKENSFAVDLAENGEDGAHLAQTGSYDLIILDVMLPVRDGWSVIADLRTHNISTPVIYLTARDAVHDRVKGLEIGADDYLVKPFVFSKLLARVRTILRREGSYLHRAKRRHSQHHHSRQPCNFGVTTACWDRIFGSVRLRE